MNRRSIAAVLAAVVSLGVAGVVVPQSAAAAPSACSYVATGYRPFLSYGSTGLAVKQAQCLSNVWGGVPKLEVDGVFGEKTRTKIKWIQGCHGLSKDGIVGPATWDALYNPVPDCYDPYPA